MDILPFMMICGGIFLVLVMMIFAFSGPSAGRAFNRRLDDLRERYSDTPTGATMAGRVRVMTAQQGNRTGATRLLPNAESVRKRLAMTGKPWTVRQYWQASAGILIAVAAAAWLQGFPPLLALMLGLMFGAGIPHFVVSMAIRKRAAKFNLKFADGIELMVRGLRSGLPISETMGVVGSEVDGPVGEEFRLIADRMKIGRTMDAALQETADRIGTPEFQFFVITIAIQRETGGNLAETLGNLAGVLRARIQMKLKVKAMSSEARASAYILGALPFVVFGLISATSGAYMQAFYVDTRLIIVTMGGLVWMTTGVLIMAKMVNFKI